jgi:hypothetical protein
MYVELLDKIGEAETVEDVKGLLERAINPFQYAAEKRTEELHLREKQMKKVYELRDNGSTLMEGNAREVATYLVNANYRYLRAGDKEAYIAGRGTECVLNAILKAPSEDNILSASHSSYCPC